VGVLNIFHPVHFGPTGIYEDIHLVAGWWITLHVLNLFGFVLLGLAAYLLMLDQHGIAATVAKIALVVFVPAYAGFDSVIGIGTGNLVQYANRLQPDQLAAFLPAVDAYWVNGIATMLAIIGSVSWTFAMSASAISFAESRRVAAGALGVIAGGFTGWGYSSSMFGTLPWWIGVAVIGAISILVVRPALPYTLLILAGILFGTTHVVPFGPLGMACFAAAVALLQSAPRTVRVRQAGSQPTARRTDAV
jgi:hypothetical protein